MGRQNDLPPSLRPIGATKEVAAAFCSFSTAKFMNLVERGLMPKPKRVDGMARWDLEEVRISFKALPSEDDDEQNPWDQSS